MPISSANNAYTWESLTSALQRFIYLMAAIGIIVILIYGWRYRNTGAFAVISVALMVAAAALLSGGLLGFLFGVPHTEGREVGQSGPTTEGEAFGLPSDRGLLTSYRPNTSLEQISDWLTKILVGVGLVEIKVIPGKLTSLAAYIAKGMGTGEGAEAFALSLVIYFTACGFVFGFLWARLYLVRLFREGDTVKALKARLSRLEEQQRPNASASESPIDDSAAPIRYEE